MCAKALWILGRIICNLTIVVTVIIAASSTGVSKEPAVTLRECIALVIP